ncbi:MAG: flavodoxin [Erysipelotrichaceae bacterium]
MKKILIAYFSASGTTRSVANHVAKLMNATLYEIEPEVPYTHLDLDWQNDTSRSSLEMQDKASRPVIQHVSLDLREYDTIIIGFPIWWYQAPTIINTFLEHVDCSNKTIYPFGTSMGSGYGKSNLYLASSLPQSTKLMEGRILSKRTTVHELLEWIDE